MNLGLWTGCLGEVSLTEVARWAGESAFQSLEVPCALRGPAWYDGARLVPSKIDEAAAVVIEELLTAIGLRLSCLSYLENMLDADPATRDTRWKRLTDRVRVAARLRVPTVCCLVGRDAQARVGESIATWARLAEETLRAADEVNVRLAVHTAPLCGHGGAEDLPGNLAFAPELWEKLFTHAKSDAVGLCLDPSSLEWLGVDVLEAVTAYAERIYHVHARDVEIFPDRRSDCACLRPSGGWWRYRLPGLGQVDWRHLVDRLQENGYDGALSIVHEDPVWSGSQDRVKRGLIFSRNHLAQFVV